MKFPNVSVLVVASLSGEKFKQMISSSTKVSELKQMISILTGIDFSKQSLFYDKNLLSDEIVLKDLIKSENNMIHLIQNQNVKNLSQMNQISKQISEQIQNLDGFTQYKNEI